MNKFWVLLCLVVGFSSPGCEGASDNGATDQNGKTDLIGSELFCYQDSDCNDNDPCSADRCFNRGCFHTYVPSDNFKQGNCGLYSHLYLDDSVDPAVPACGLAYNQNKTIDICDDATGCYTLEVLCPSLLEMGVDCVFQFDCTGLDVECLDDGKCMAKVVTP